MRLFEGVGFLGPAARVLARASDARLDRVHPPADVVGKLVEIERRRDGADLVGEQAFVALHLGDAVFELGACVQRRAQFVQRLQRLLDRAERGLAPGLAKPGPGARLAPGSKPIGVRFLCDSELGLGASGLGAALLRLLPQRSELGLDAHRRFRRFDQRLEVAVLVMRDAQRRAKPRSGVRACARPRPRRGAQRPPSAAAHR